MSTTGLTVLLLCSLYGAMGNEVVPALFWSPERAMSDLPDASSRDILQPDAFTGHYLKPLMETASHSAVVFLQDKLHMDDFTKFADVYSVDSTGGAFKNIKNLMEENFSLELPQVSQASKAVDELKQKYKGKVHSIGSTEELSSLGVSSKSPFLLIVHLPPTASNIDQEAAFTNNDKMIGAVCNHLSKRGVKYTALYTGKAASQGMVEEGEVHSSGRHLLAEEEVQNNNGTFINITVAGSSNIYLYMRNIAVCVKDKASPKGCALSFNLSPKDAKTDKTIATNDSAEVILDFAGQKGNNGSSDPYNIAINMNVVDKKDEWIMTGMQLNVEPVTPKGGNETDIKKGNLTNLAVDFTVPILYSFHCTELNLYLNTLGESEDMANYTGTFVQITGFQFQPFMIQNDRFFNSVDCVGFFTAGIWMGLVPVLLLLTILLGGTMMLLNLSIMDRYDDPKGKTITVHTQGGD